jgi:hypothetical protein
MLTVENTGFIGEPDGAFAIANCAGGGPLAHYRCWIRVFGQVTET